MAQAIKIVVTPVGQKLVRLTVMGRLADGRYFIADDPAVPLDSVEAGVSQLVENAEKNLRDKASGTAVSEA